MRRLVYLLTVLALVAAFFPSSVLALNDTADTAIVLTAQNAGDAGQLVGDRGGAGRFYRIDYPEGGQPVKIAVTMIPGRNSFGGAAGFKVYGPSGLIGEAPVEQNETTWTRFSLTLSGATAGSYLIQVYNFTAGMAIDFNIQVTGLPGTSAQPPSEQPPAAPIGTNPDQPSLITQPNANFAGSLVGKRDGTVQFLSLDYPGGGAAMTVELKYSPPSPFPNGAVGFKLYDGSDLIAQGAEIQRDGSSVTVSYTLMRDAGGTLLLQVFNYEPDFTANFVLNITGAAGPVQQVTDNTVPGKAFLLTSQISAARGSIGPGNEATFNYFLFNHPGNGATVTIRLTVEQADGIIDKKVGFNVYKGATLAGHADATLDANGNKRVAFLSIADGSAASYGIQVFNYSNVAPARYSIYVTGLP